MGSLIERLSREGGAGATASGEGGAPMARTFVYLLGVAAALALATLLLPAALHWLIVLAGLTVAGLAIAELRGRIEGLVGLLRSRVSQQETIARIGKRALSVTDLSELFEWTSRTVAESLEVERVAVLGLPDRRSLMFRAGTGWDRDAVRSAVIPFDDPLAGRALLASGPVLFEGRLDEERPLAALDLAALRALPAGSPLRGVAAPIRDAGETHGVIAAYGAGGRPFADPDARFLQAVADVLAEAIRRAAVEEETRRQVVYDPVTGRPNRVLFLDRLGEAVLRAKRDGSSLAIFIVEIDEFKIINDSYGDLFGNALLRAFAARLREPLYIADTVARLGGPEFGVLCEDLDVERGAVEIAEELVRALQEPFEIGGESIRVTASMGVAVLDRDVAARELLSRADAALYTARGLGLGAYQLFDERLQTRLQQRVTLSQALREAPERGELALVTQPIVSIPGGQVRGCECLLRWHHPERGPIAPLDFLPVAEETGSILAIGGWVVREGMLTAARWRAELGEGAPLPLNINISPRQLGQADFAARVERTLGETGARPADLAFEITEHALLRDAEIAAEALAAVRSLGIAVALDDFGTGYSSLSHLSRFPLDVVKIDRLFISRIAEPNDEAIVAAVIRMGEALGLEVVAEGVETREQERRLVELDCRLAQGMLYGRPEPPPEFVESLSRTADRASSTLE